MASQQRGTWSLAQLQRAVRDVLVYHKSVRSVSKTHAIPRQTLHRHLLKCKAGLGVEKTIGRKPVLSEAQEDQLVDLILRMQSNLFGLTRNDTRRLAFSFCEQNNIEHPFNSENGMAGKDWFSGFMLRHPNLSMRVPEPVSIQRAMGFNRTKVTRFMDVLETLLFSDTIRVIPPEDIYNADESGISVCQDPSRIIAKKGTKASILRSAEKGRTVTVLLCVNAVGNYIPPLMIFPRARLKPGKMTGLLR